MGTAAAASQQGDGTSHATSKPAHCCHSSHARPPPQALNEFQGTKRTCQRALDSHNARRRKREEAKRTVSPSGGTAAEGGGDASPSAQRQTHQRQQRGQQQEQQRSGSGGITGSASGQGGSPHAAGGSSARAGSGATLGDAPASREAQQSADAAAAHGQQGTPSSPEGTAGPTAAAAAAVRAPSSHFQPRPPPAWQQAQAPQPPFDQQQQQQQALMQQVQAGWQPSLGGPELEHSSYGQQGDSSLLAQHGSGSFYSAGAQTQASGSMQPTGSGHTQPGSSPFAPAGLPLLPLGAAGAHGSGFYPNSPELPRHPSGAALVPPMQQLPVGWPAAAAPPVPQLQPWGGAAAEHQAAMPMLHAGSNGAVPMPGLILPVPQQLSCLGGGAAFAPLQAGYAPAVAAGLGPTVDEMTGVPEVGAWGIIGEVVLGDAGWW